jgi:hypothetical protein
LDEGIGDVAGDSSGNGLDGTIVEANWVEPGYDDAGFCLEMDRVGYVDLGNPDALNFGTSDWTVTSWVNTTISGTDETERGTIFGNGGDWGGGVRYTSCISETQDGMVTLTCDDDSTKVQATATTAVNDGEWHFVVAMREGTEISVHIDGQREGENSVPASYDLSGTSQHNAYLGAITDHRDASLKKTYAGLIDEVRVYSRALSQGHIQGLYEGKAPNFHIAGDPSPADGDNAVVLALFQWSPGLNALLHDVYLGTDPNLGPDHLVQSRIPMAMYFHPAGLVPGTTYYWRVDEIEADMTTVHTGDVWTFLAQPFTAYLPAPADASYEASPDPNLALTWLPGQLAFEHQLYFGSSFSDVNEGAAATDMGITTETTFVLSDPLQPLATYYWRVDEIGAAGTAERGEVWSFATFSAIDDFESYTNDVGSRPFEVWIDGIGFSLPEPGNPGNGTGAAVGHDIWDPNSPHYNGSLMETGNVHGGLQAMPVSYNNSVAPNYSEIDRTWAAPQNWTANGANAIVLYVRGASGNVAEPMYVAVEDNARNVGIATQDATVVTTASWTQVEIPISAFTDAGVNMGAVKKMIVGFGDRNAPVPGGAGTVLFDDIRLVKAAAAE